MYYYTYLFALFFFYELFSEGYGFDGQTNKTGHTTYTLKLKYNIVYINVYRMLFLRKSDGLSLKILFQKRSFVEGSTVYLVESSFTGIL